MSGGRFGDGETGRDIRKQSHRDELGGADAESAEGQCQHRKPTHRGCGGDNGDGDRHGSFKRDGQKRWTFLWSDVGNGNETFDKRQTDLGILTAKVRQVTIGHEPDQPYLNR